MANSLKAKLTEELKTALRTGDKCRLSTIRMLLATIKNAEIEKHGELDDSQILVLVARECKKHNESIEAFKAGNRPDLVEKEEAELAVLKGYLPAQLGRDEIINIARKAVEQSGARTPQEKGKVMAILMPQIKGRADGKLVNEVVEDLLKG